MRKALMSAQSVYRRLHTFLLASCTYHQFGPAAMSFAPYSTPTPGQYTEAIVGPDRHVPRLWILIAPPDHAIRQHLNIYLHSYRTRIGTCTAVCERAWWDKFYIIFRLENDEYLAVPFNWSYLPLSDRLRWYRERPKLLSIMFLATLFFDTPHMINNPFEHPLSPQNVAIRRCRSLPEIHSRAPTLPVNDFTTSDLIDSSSCCESDADSNDSVSWTSSDDGQCNSDCGSNCDRCNEATTTSEDNDPPSHLHDICPPSDLPITFDGYSPSSRSNQVYKQLDKLIIDLRPPRFPALLQRIAPNGTDAACSISPQQHCRRADYDTGDDGFETAAELWEDAHQGKMVTTLWHRDPKLTTREPQIADPLTLAKAFPGSYFPCSTPTRTFLGQSSQV